MNINILGENNETLAINCKYAYLLSTDDTLAITFDDDGEARNCEEMIKKMNIKTKHINNEISLLNISNFNLSFS